MQNVSIDLQERAHQREADEAAAFEEISLSLDSLASHVESIVAHQAEVLFKAEAESQAVAHPIMDIMGSIQFQDIVRQQLEQLQEMTTMVDDHIASLGASLPEPEADPGEAELTTKLDEYSGRFRMNSQRNSLKIARGGSIVADAAPLIEMF